MRVQILGGGPAGLYAAVLLKKAHPAWEIALTERNPAGATYGWGVVFSDRTLTGLREADPQTYAAITGSFVLWEAIDVHVRDQLVRCEGHAFAGIARRRLLDILQRRCAELGVALRFETEAEGAEGLPEADLVIAADGINSRTRARHADAFGPATTEGRARFIWFGADRLFDAFTFIFRENAHGLFQVHAYPFDETRGTFIVECGEATWRRAGLHEADEATSLAYCEALFADHLGGGRHRLLSNHSRWLTFLTLKNRRWRHENIVLLGDAAHTAHFSIGSGTKLALEDAIALAQAFEGTADVPTALRRYELARRPRVEATQAAALESQRYFEEVARYRHVAPRQFAFHLLTRSGRITYDNLKGRDPHFVAEVERAFAVAARAGAREKEPIAPLIAPPPLFAPLTLRGVTLPGRAVLAPPPDYAAAEGLPGEGYGAWIARLAAGGAGLVLTGPVAVSAAGRITPGCAGLYAEEHAAAWARIVAEARGAGPATLGLQLSHAGARASTRPRDAGIDRPLRDGGWPLLAASARPYGPANQTPRAMGCDDLALVREEFARAARRADEAGFDLLLLNAAHGYLLASFLSPLTNARDDEYGGSPAGRLRGPLEVFAAVRAAWPAAKPLAVALSVDDWAPRGLTIADAVPIARAFKEAGCDLIAVTAGQTTAASRPRYDPETLAALSDHLRNEAGIATLSTGYLTTSNGANTLLAGGRADLCLIQPPRPPTAGGMEN